MLWSSGDITQNGTVFDQWTTYTYTLEPTQSWDWIALVVNSMVDWLNPAVVATSYQVALKTNVYIGVDNLTLPSIEIIPAQCECPDDSYTMVDNLGNPTTECRETNQCVRTICNCKVIDGNSPTLETGNCDTYEEFLGLEINPLPYTCYYDFQNCVEPSNELGGIWKHNVRCDLFANYYAKQYPWEIELVSSMGQTVEMLRSVEYQLEVFDYITNYAKRS